MRRILSTFTLLVLMFTVLASAHATDVSILFQPASQTGAPGSTLNYSAVFTNNTATDLWITGASFNAADGDFFGSGSYGLFNGDGNTTTNGAFLLSANQSLTVTDVVSLVLDPNIPLKTYSIDASFTGKNYTDRDDETVFERELGTKSLEAVVNSAPVPEPAFYQMSALLALGGVGVWRMCRKR